MTLAAHELATNAAKYGALSTDSGTVHCTWRTSLESGEMRLHLEWREVGGPPVRTPTRRGFGSRMIERALAADMAGVARLSFEPDGLRCTLDAPIQAPR
jgi:two-component sensor histidine kinase